MKKTLIALSLILSCVPAFAIHSLPQNASNLITGTLPNARLDPSSVTLQGNNVSISTVAGGLNKIYDGTSITTVPCTAVDKTSFTMQGNNVNISTLAVGWNEFISRSSNTAFMNLDGSPQTKAGPVTLASVTINGLTVVKDSATFYGTVTSSSGFKGNINGVDVSTLAVGWNEFISRSSNTAFMNLDGSTQTKVGGMIFGGSIACGSAAVNETMTVKDIHGQYGDVTISTAIVFGRTIADTLYQDRIIRIAEPTLSLFGGTLTLRAGDSGESVTNGYGGNLILQSGFTTGNRNTFIEFFAVGGGASGSNRNYHKLTASLYTYQMIFPELNFSIGISTTIPMAKLHINGNPGQVSDLLLITTNTAVQMKVSGSSGTAYVPFEFKSPIILPDGTSFSSAPWSGGGDKLNSWAGGKATSTVDLNGNVINNIASATVRGTITSTSGFIAGGSTFTTVNATRFIGDGSLLTGLPSGGSSVAHSTTPLSCRILGGYVYQAPGSGATGAGGMGKIYDNDRSTAQIAGQIRFTLDAVGQSTVTAVFVALGKSSGTIALGQTSTCTFMTGWVEITTGATSSVWVTPSITQIDPEYSLYLYVYNNPATPGGNPPYGLSAVISAWREEYVPQ